MTVRHLIILLMVAAGICLAAMFFLPWSARGDEYTVPCIDAEAAVGRLVDGGAMDLGRFELETRSADAVVFIEFKGYVMAILTRKGCVVSDPAVVDVAKDRGVGT